MDRPALLPCPFCGETLRRYDYYAEHRGDRSCLLYGQTFVTTEFAAWNRRTPSREVNAYAVAPPAAIGPECENVTSAAPGNPPEDGSPGNPASPISGPPNCPLVTGLRPCMCDLPRCPDCNYTAHDAQFEGDHRLCGGTIPGWSPISDQEIEERR